MKRREPPPEKRPKTEDDLFDDARRDACAKAVIKALKESGINLQRPIASFKMNEIVWLAEAAVSTFIVESAKRMEATSDPAEKKKLQNFLYGG